MKTPPPGRTGTPAAERAYAVSDVRAAEPAPIPLPPFWGSRVVRGIPLRDVYPWINEIALFRGQWQYQRGKRGEAEHAEFVEAQVRPVFRRLQDEAIRDGILVPQVVYGYFPCLAEGNGLVVWPGVEGDAPAGAPVRFQLPRQPSGRRLCIADFFLGKEQAAEGLGRRPDGSRVDFDTLAITLVTMGPKATAHTAALFAKNEYRDYLHWHGFAVEGAEGLAEMWHARVRQELGIAGKDGATKREIFQQGYQGGRYSFGYPACPDLEEQVHINALLEPSRIGVDLGETFQWHPEQTTSAIVAHHPGARYFVIR